METATENRTEQVTENRQTVFLSKKQWPGSLGFDELRFVLSARGTDTTREFLTILNVEESEESNRIAVCTDGRRLHTWDTNKLTPMGIEPGHWGVLKSTKGEIVLVPVPEGKYVFPNWQRIVPNEKNLSDPVHIDLDCKQNIMLMHLGREYARIVRTFGSIFNLNFLRDLHGWYWTVRTLADGEGKAPHVFTEPDQGLMAVIMPMEPDK